MHVNLFPDGPSNVYFLTNVFAYIIALRAHCMPICFSKLIMLHRKQKGKVLKHRAHITC
jgi:hypothetical protein